MGTGNPGYENRMGSQTPERTPAFESAESKLIEECFYADVKSRASQNFLKLLDEGGKQPRGFRKLDRADVSEGVGLCSTPERNRERCRSSRIRASPVTPSLPLDM